MQDNILLPDVDIRAAVRRGALESRRVCLTASKFAICEETNRNESEHVNATAHWTHNRFGDFNRCSPRSSRGLGLLARVWPKRTDNNER